ncbi:MAG: tRNA (adenosine(37)-N6)-threonylcarbamoyltransferase complex dimerization subunit type 1 TsaB [Gemmatimonadales bacterium]
MSQGPWLALETATDVASVALGTPGSWTAQLSVVGARKHAAGLQVAVGQLLTAAGLGAKDLGGFVVGDGPGTFTGLRIAAAVAKGMAQEHGLPVIAIPSLLGAALSAHALAGGPVAALYDALRGDVFVALYDFGRDRVDVLMAPRVAAAGDLVAATATLARERPRVCVGDGAMAYADVCRRWSGRDPVAFPAAGPGAGWLLVALKYSALQHPLEDVAGWEPAYGRAAEAQVRWEKAHGRALPDSTG